MTFVLSSLGLSFYLENTGKYTTCKLDWQLQDDGNYKCPSTGKIQLCYDVQKKASSSWCWIGKKVNIEEKLKVHCNNQDWDIQSTGFVTPYTKISVGTNEGYLGECI